MRQGDKNVDAERVNSVDYAWYRCIGMRKYADAWPGVGTRILDAGYSERWVHAPLALVLRFDLKHGLGEDAIVLAIRIRVYLDDVILPCGQVRRDISLEVCAVKGDLSRRHPSSGWEGAGPDPLSTVGPERVCVGVVGKETGTDTTSTPREHAISQRARRFNRRDRLIIGPRTACSGPKYECSVAKYELTGRVARS